MNQELMQALPNQVISTDETTPVIIGLSLKLPYIDNEEALWQFLLAGKKSRCTVDEPRAWRSDDETSYANLLPNWDFFCPSSFNLIPEDIALIDPQQKLALYGVQRCLENACITRSELQRATTGVYAGVMSVDSLHYHAAKGSEIDRRFFLNHCEACVANRVSHCFNFSGESKSINAACTSSLIALKDACDSIQRGQNDFAFVIGVNHVNSKLRHQSFKKAGMLSRSGWCNSFSIQADGYLPAEGMVTLLVTTKAKAEAINANILAAVVAIASNHNGQTTTMTAPDVIAQLDLISTTQKQCNFLDVAYVEAHGTGNSLGDPIELEALSRIYPDCFVGSIKANLGHMEAGAGLLGVAKCLMILKHKQLPPHPLQDKPNILLPKNIRINTDPVAYNHSQVAVSSFGYSGANAHAILQMLPKQERIQSEEQFKLPLLLSAATEDSLMDLVAVAENQFQQILAEDQGYNLALNSVYTFEHSNKHRLAAWIDNCRERLEWVSNQQHTLLLPIACSDVGDIGFRDYLNQALVNCTNLTNYWLNLIDDFMPPVCCIEGQGAGGVALALEVNQRLQTNLLLEGEKYPALVMLDWYVLELIHGLAVNPSLVNTLIEESIELYQYQYTFKALIQTILDPELIILFDKQDPRFFQHYLTSHELIILLLWARVSVTNKWQLDTVRAEFLHNFPEAYHELIILLENKVLEIEELKSLLHRDQIFIANFKRKLIETVTTINEVNSFILLPSYYQPTFVCKTQAFAAESNQCIFYFKQGTSITLECDLSSENTLLTLSDNLIVNLWMMGLAIDFSLYLGSKRFERKSYFKKPNKQEEINQLYTQQTTLNCLDDSKVQLKTVGLEELSALAQFGKHQDEDFASATPHPPFGHLLPVSGAKGKGEEFFGRSDDLTAHDLCVTIEYQNEEMQFKKEMLPQQSIEKEFSPKIDEILQTKPPQILEELREITPVVVGYSACLPGCDDLNDFWQLLLAQQDVFSQTPANRLKYMQQHPGTFIQGVEEFDAAFFNLSPIEAKVMDPQQRLLLQQVWHALEMAGIKPQQLRGSATGVYVGASTFDYAKLLTRNNIDNPYIAVATVHSLLANRISHYFDLCGPSEAVDTACSSGLYALDRAVNAIKQGEVEQAIVCGVNLLLDDEFFHAFTQSGMLSATSLCKPFDKKADGYIRGEGIIVIILQNQTIAQEQNNTIYARILATAVNHTGKANTLTSPSSKAQQQLYERVYAKVNINRISYLEAHGTGTLTGDPIEIEGLKNWIGDKKLAIEVGSVKGNIGHLEPASGLAGLIKILLMFQHNIIPGQANLSEINPYLALGNSGISISQQTHSWPQSIVAGELVPRCAAVNSFGFGGVNAHVVLEQAVEISDSKKTSFIPLMPLSAENQTSLRFLVKNYVEWLQKNEAISPASLCVTLQQRRFHHRFRVLFQWQTKRQIIADMQHWLNEPNTLKIATEYESIAQTYLAGKAAFVDEIDQHNALPVHPTPVYPFLKKKIWFETQKNQLIYVENDLVSDDKITLKPLERQCILWIYSACFDQAIADISSQLESNNKILRYLIDGFDANEFASFLLSHEGIDRLIIYPEIAPFTLELNLCDNSLINNLQPLFELAHSSLKCNT